MSLDTETKQQSVALQKFLATVSHDLAGPLRQIISFSEILDDEERERLSDDGRIYLRSIMSAGSRMQDMLNGLLRLARVESRGAAFEPCDLGAVMNETLERLSDEITNRNVSVTQTDLPTIDADPAQISLLFQEILQNSLKFSDKASPSITIKTAPSKNAEHVRIIIQDNGIGFESQYASQMFEVFMRLNNPGDYPGTGVGLTLCQAICTRHGGNIQARATPDEGAQIIVSLPMQQNASAPSAQVAS